MTTETVGAHIRLKSAFVLHTIQLLIQYIYLSTHVPKQNALNFTSPFSFTPRHGRNTTSPNIPATNDVVSAPTKEHLGTRCGYCLCKTFWIFLVLVIILVMLVILVLYIIITPRSFRFHVTDAKLTQFDYAANTTTLSYNLVLNITASNPNKKLKIYYDVVRANALYGGVRFSTSKVNMPWNSYLQDKKSTNLFSAVFSGQHVMVFDRNQVSDFNEDSNDGVFPIDIKIKFRIRFRLGDYISGHFNARATCELNVPFTDSDGKTVAATAFESTKCQVDF